MANKTKAELYDLPTRRSELKPMRSFVNPAGTKRESALGASPPGRVMNRSGGVRQSYESKHSLKEQAEGYRAKVIGEAEGDSQRFGQILARAQTRLEAGSGT